jgi:membrane protease YdiL (CAAX protease family)
LAPKHYQASLKDLVKILSYFLGVLLLGCLAAPPLYWAGRALASLGWFQFLGNVDFEKYFHRALLLPAIGLLWPLGRSLRVRGLKDLRMTPDRRPFGHFCLGFTVSGLTVALMAATYLGTGVYRLKSVLPWSTIPKLLIGALTVGLLEEGLFRGALLGIFERTMGRTAALLSVTLLFSSLHFLRADEAIASPGDAAIHWFSAFELLPSLFHKFHEPTLLAAEFSTLSVFGWMLGRARQRTGAIWLSAGLHSGLVFVKMAFSKFSKRNLDLLPWVGPELQIGLVPVAALLVCAWVVWWRLQIEKESVRLESLG